MAKATIEQDSIRYKNMRTKPWLDSEGQMLWSPAQIWFAKIIFSQYFETLMGSSSLLSELRQDQKRPKRRLPGRFWESPLSASEA